MKAARQPHAAASSGTAIGATIAPMLVPELKMPGGERALALREPLRHGLDRGREVRRLADAEQEPRERRSPSRCSRERGAHAGERPPRHRDRQTQLGADAIEDAAPDQHHHRVRDLERDDDAAVIELGPADLLLQVRREDAEHLAVDVVDGRGEEQQRADDPAPSADAGADRRDVDSSRVAVGVAMQA